MVFSRVQMGIYILRFLSEISKRASVDRGGLMILNVIGLHLVLIMCFFLVVC